MSTEGSHIYIISGLSADHRVFEQLTIPLPHTHIPWIQEEKNEDLSHYAKRMAEAITHDNPILMGLSFGGIIAQEIACIRPVKQLILLSTIASKKDMPWYFKWIRRSRVFSLVPHWYYTKAHWLTYWFFSLNHSDNKKVLDRCFENSNRQHIRWAIQNILAWEGCNPNVPTSHIHSAGDRIFPYKKVHATHTVQGGHFAVYTEANQVSTALKQILHAG